MKKKKAQAKGTIKSNKKSERNLSPEERNVLKQKYDYLIQNQCDMPGDDKAAEAIIQYYLFQLDELRKSFPYDAMGCESTIRNLLQQKFQKKTVVNDILTIIGRTENLSVTQLEEEVEKFLFVYF